MLLFALPVVADHGAPIGITFRDGATDCIRSDGKLGVDQSKEYSDGVEGVRAVLHSTGQIAVELGSTRPYVNSRHVFFDFQVPAPGSTEGCTPPFMAGTPWRSDFEIAVMNPGGFEAMYEGQIADGVLSFDIHPVYLHEHWWLQFNTAVHQNSSYVVVERTGSTWTVTADEYCVAELLVPGKKGIPNHSACGFYYMPFQMTIRKL